MGSNRDNNKDKNKHQASTSLIRDMLNKKITKDEAALPDHLLGEGSQEKKKRNNDREYLALLDAEIARYQIQIMVQKAQIKYLEDQEFYKSLQRAEDKTTFYNNLLRQFINKEMAAAKLLEEQYERLKAMKHNFDAVSDAISRKYTLLNENISTTRTEINDLRNRIPAITDRYSDVFANSFANRDNFNSFTHSRLNTLQVYPEGFSRADAEKRKWSVEINADDFSKLGVSIARAIRADRNISTANINRLITSETTNYVRNKLAESIHDMPAQEREKLIARLEASPEVMQLVQTLVSQVKQHVQQGETHSQLQKVVHEYEHVQTQIEHKEELLQTLEKQVALLDKYREALESAAELSEQIMKEQKYDPEQFEQLINASQSVIKDAITACELPVAEIQLDDDPFAEKEETSSPRPR